MTFSNYHDLSRVLGRTGAETRERPVVCVQGLGFVGFAMAVAVANARDERGDPVFDVVGVDLPTPEGLAKVAALNAGDLPFNTTDPKLLAALTDCHRCGNLIATIDERAYGLASTVIVDVHLDIEFDASPPTIKLGGFAKAIETIGRWMRPDALIVVETTVPPGTCERVVVPTLRRALRERGIEDEALLVAHSYERVMPGADYFDSIVHFWRVFAGYTDAAGDACERFLSRVVNVRDYPLTRLHSTTASETAKVLENSYRATNIAFIEEWGRFAEAVGIDLFQVISAIRVRPTHSNMRQPGFGVGGYCLTKDPLFAAIAARELFGLRGLEFPVSTRAVQANQQMPIGVLAQLRGRLGADLRGSKILLLGVSYRQDVGDTRYSPSEVFVRAARDVGASVVCHDPLVDHWIEMDMDLPARLPDPAGLDALVLAVPHREYVAMDWVEWLGTARPFVLDANDVLPRAQRDRLRAAGVRIESVGRGDGL